MNNFEFGNLLFSLRKKINLSQSELAEKLGVTNKLFLNGKMAIVNQIRKTRYCLIYKNQYFEIDIYPDWKDKAIWEIELNDENQEIYFPKFLEIIKEVTNDENFKNSNLASIV